MNAQAAALKRQEDALLLPTYDRVPVVFERGRGVYLYDARGRRYLDFLSGIGVNALGHGHPAIRRAIAEQAGRLVHISNLFYHPLQAALAARLTAISGLDRAFFSNSGTEAWEGALKLARSYAKITSRNGRRPRWRILALENSFHGRTFGSLATTGQAKYRDPFAPLMPGVEFVRFNNVADLTAKFDSSVCAVGLETIQGESGIRPVSRTFFEAAHALTRKHNALLLVDEIQCGLGRTGRYFAYQQFGIRPNIVTVAKPLAGGLPLGAILTTDRVARAIHPGMHGTTFGGGPLACAAAIAFLDTLKRERILPHVRKVGRYLARRLAELQKKYAAIREVRCIGLMVGVELDSADLAKQVVEAMLDRRIVINRTHDTVLRLLPPYIVTEQHVDEVVDALDRVLAAGASSPQSQRQHGGAH
jgi:acetylornithine aminotransferase/acetylornithine/N-succinyldiaminopimelate aminotransferase